MWMNQPRGKNVCQDAYKKRPGTSSQSPATQTLTNPQKYRIESIEMQRFIDMACAIGELNGRPRGLWKALY
jgi:hypothetical protein